MVLKINYQTVPLMAYNSIKELILNNSLKPGQKIRQQEMASRLGISRIPLRQALFKLENEGLVIAYPRRGFYVKEIKIDELGEILDIRVVIESVAINLITENLTSSVREKLLGFLNDFNIAFNSKDIKKYFLLDRKFHHYLIEASGNRILKRVSEITNIQVLRYIKGFELDINISFNHHKKLIDYILNNKSQEASDLIKTHFNIVKNSFKFYDK